MKALVFGTSTQPYTPPPDAPPLLQNLAVTPVALAGHPRRAAAAARLARHPSAAHRHLRLRLEADPPRLR